MKKLFLPMLCLVAAFAAQAQSPFTTRDTIDINNISASVMVHGDMWWNPSYEVAACEFPKGSGKNIGFAGSLWMSGVDDAGLLHISAQTYRQNGNDYWPGPLNSADTLPYATSQMWAKIWKVNRTDIQSFLGFTTHDTVSTPASILRWPGKGNTYAQGNAGAMLTITEDMAPFVDLNGDGLYEPLEGEYPDFNGEQALFWVFSDNGHTHSATNGRPLDVEVHALAYAYKRNTLIDNVDYYSYTVINKSPNTYTGFRLAIWADLDLGWYDDDYIGFDSSHRMGIIYNGIPRDGLSGGFPVNSYDSMIPMAGVTIVNMPGDSAGAYRPAGSFTYYNNDMSIVGNPSSDTQYYYYLHSQLRNGQHFTNDFAGSGIPSQAYGAGPNCNYVFNGALGGDSTQWTECNCNNTPGDRRFIVTTNDYTLAAGATTKMTIAMVTTNPDTLNSCPSGTFDSILVYADTAWNDFYNPLPVLPEAVHPVATVLQNGLTLYPNPTTGYLNFKVAGKTAAPADVLVTNTVGQTIQVPAVQRGDGVQLDTRSLAAGVYFLHYTAANATVMFIKQ
jgi:Secretion system C-terminal sorting domain